MKLMVRLFLAFAFVFCSLAQYTPIASAHIKGNTISTSAHSERRIPAIQQQIPSYKSVDTPPGITDEYDGTSQEDDQNEEEETEDSQSTEQFFTDTQYIAGILFSLVTGNTHDGPVSYITATSVRTAAPVGRCILYQIFRI